MIDYQQIFHTGHLVHDLEQGMERYGKALNLGWCQPFTFESLPLWTPEQGLQHLRLEVTYSDKGPQRLEIQVGPRGSYYDPELRSGFHIGVWVDDVPAEVAALRTQGWTVTAAGATPDEGWGTFVYLVPPGGGLTVELVSTTIRGNLESWWNGATGIG